MFAWLCCGNNAVGGFACKIALITFSDTRQRFVLGNAKGTGQHAPVLRADPGRGVANCLELANTSANEFIKLFVSQPTGNPQTQLRCIAIIDAKTCPLTAGIPGQFVL